MLKTLLDSMTAQQRAKLRENGLSTQQITNLKLGINLPTQNQVVAIADAMGVDGDRLQLEVGLLRAKKDDKPEQVRLIERALGKARGVVAMLIFGVSVAVAGAALGLSNGAPSAFLRRRYARQCILCKLRRIVSLASRDQRPFRWIGCRNVRRSAFGVAVDPNPVKRRKLAAD